MSGRGAATESVKKVIRRKHQIDRWRQSHTKTDPSLPLGHSHAVTASARASASPATTSSSASQSPPLMDANRNLQRVYLETLKESKLQRTSRQAISAAASKDEALEVFFLLARSTEETVSNATFRALTSSLVKHHTVGQIGMDAYNASLVEAVGSSEDRWKDVSSEEENIFSLYQRTRLERHEAKGTSFNEALSLTLEGADNNTVSLIEYQIRRHSAQSVPVTTDILTDLTHLDVSWSAALRLYEYAKELRGVHPPIEMTNRLMSLMTGYKSNGLGSRPWQAALELYRGVLNSGLDATLSTHTCALDALWRSADTYHRKHHQLSDEESQRVWQGVCEVKDNVQRQQLQIIGDEGCAYMEGLVKAAGAAGKWDVAVELLQDTAISAEDTTHGMLIPTPETFLFAMASCHAAGHAGHAESVGALLRSMYTLRQAHPEALLVYLQALRHTVQTCASTGKLVEELVSDGLGLDRLCALACLQLLASRHVRTKTSKSRLAVSIYKAYDANAWPQQPLARKVELQTVFRCCHLIGTGDGGSDGEHLLKFVRTQIASVFGEQSPEMEWLGDTEIYSLHVTTDWDEAVAIFERQVKFRPAEHVKYLPVPVSQTRHMLVEAMLRCCRLSSRTEDDGGFLLDDAAQEEESTSVSHLAQKSIAMAEDVYADAPAAAPHAMIAELQLIMAAHTPDQAFKKATGVKAMRRLALASASAVTPTHIQLVSRVLDLTEEHVEGVLCDGHARLRGSALQDERGCSIIAVPVSAVERTYM